MSLPQRKLLLWAGRIILLCCTSLNACMPTTAAPMDTTDPSKTITLTRQPAETKTHQIEASGTYAPTQSSALSTPTPDLRLRYELWQSWPVYPQLSQEMIAVYLRGQESGRDGRAFSVIGDCQSSPTYFLSLYDEGRYALPEGESQLEETIAWYAGSFSHRSITVANGLTAPGALNPRWSDPTYCHKEESPIACEVRLHNPSLVLISLGTNWHPSLSHADYLEYLYQIIEMLLAEDIVPILSTKADNVEGDHGRNLAMAQAAYEFHLPLWNFWATVQHLPNGGLDKTRNNEYLTRKGWDVRNLSALMLLDQIHRQFQDAEH